MIRCATYSIYGFALQIFAAMRFSGKDFP